MIDEKNYAAIIAKNLKRIAHEHDKNQMDMSRDLKISQATISSWMNGTRIPRMDKIDRLCNYFNVSRADIMEPYSVAEESGIPILGNVAAGKPILQVTDIEGYEQVPEKYSNREEYFALRIKGSSMEPRMYDGDLVIVHIQPDIETGETAIVAVNGDEATCKKIKYQQNGMTLLSLNPSYEPIFFTDEEIRSLPVSILGKVVELRAKL